MQEESSAPVRDTLARQRTVLANERTLPGLSPDRAGICHYRHSGRVVARAAPGMQALGVVSLVTGIAIFGVGIWRFITIKAGINRQPD